MSKQMTLRSIRVDRGLTVPAVAEACVFVEAVLAHNRAAEVAGCVLVKLTAAEIAG